jgi:hypothetical protein
MRPEDATRTANLPALRRDPEQRRNGSSRTENQKSKAGAMTRLHRDPFDLACAPGFPGPPSGYTYLPSRFCVRCAVETSEATCFVCGGNTAETMPSGWYRGGEPGTSPQAVNVTNSTDNLAVPGPAGSPA